jgi:hypothetical protein
MVAKRLERRALVALVALLWACGALAANMDDYWVTNDAHDPAAPTVTIEDILAFRDRAGRAAEAERTASLRASRECMQAAPGAPVTPVAGAATGSRAPASPGSGRTRAELEAMPFEELAMLFSQTQDPEVAAVVRQRATEMSRGGSTTMATVASPTQQPVSPPVAVGTSPEQRQLRLLGQQQAVAASPGSQDCLARAGTERSPEDPLRAFWGEPFSAAIAAISKQGARTAMVDLADLTYPPGAAVGIIDRGRRFNVVPRADPLSAQARSLAEAWDRSRHHQGAPWPAPDVQVQAASPAEATRRKPSLLDRAKAMQELLKKSSP